MKLGVGMGVDETRVRGGSGKVKITSKREPNTAEELGFSTPEFHHSSPSAGLPVKFHLQTVT